MINDDSLYKDFVKQFKNELTKLRNIETLEKIIRIASESNRRKETKEEKYKRIGFEVNKSTEYWKALNRR